MILKTNRLGAKDADLFMYISEAGNEVDLKAEHINQYIRDSSGMGFTAKNFRTWAATSRCAERLAFLSTKRTAAEMKKWLKSIPSVESMDKLWSEGDWEVPTTDTGRNKAMLAVIDTVAANLATLEPCAVPPTSTRGSSMLGPTGVWEKLGLNSQTCEPWAT